MNEHLAIVGSGAIACGLAATAAHHGPVLLLARSQSSAERAQTRVDQTLTRLAVEIDPEHVQVVTEPQELSEATFVVEAVVEEYAVKEAVHAELLEVLGADAVLASTTSSLSIERLAQASGIPERFVGLHVFNPVTRMQLVELIFPRAAERADPRSARWRCARPSRRRRWWCPTCRGSSSTGCCSPTCSARCGCLKRPGCPPRTSTPA